MIRLSRGLIARSSMLLPQHEYSVLLQTIATQNNTPPEHIIDNSSPNIPEVKDELHASKLRAAFNMQVEPSRGINDTSPSERQVYSRSVYCSFDKIECILCTQFNLFYYYRNSLRSSDFTIPALMSQVGT